MSFDNVNIVLMGNNFPVSTIRPEDFDFPGVAAIEPIRTPVLTALQAGSFTLQAIPVRFQISATDNENPEASAAVLVRNAAVFCDKYIGPRAVTAVGHNMQSHILIERLNRTDVYRRLFNAEAVRHLVGDTQDVLADVVLQFRRGQADYVRLSVVSTNALPDRVVIDFNFNYDMTRADARPLNEVLEMFPESLQIAQTLEDELPAVFEMQDAQ